ncbi:MAG: hypothetical protein U5L06_12600 [Rhodovibrio sp.]|nr:hypothetical protein [Rhodovibrio sp.]
MTNPLGTERTFEEAIEAELVGGPAGPVRPGGFAEEQAPFDAGGGAPAHALNAPGEGGYRRRAPEHFDAERALDPETLFSFVMTTQPKTWAHLRTQYGDQEGQEPGAGADRSGDRPARRAGRAAQRGPGRRCARPARRTSSRRTP